MGSGCADTSRYERIGTATSFANARGQKWTSRPRSTSAEASVGPSGARATPARNRTSAGGVGAFGLNEGAGVATPRDVTGPPAGATVAVGADVAGADDAGAGEATAPLRLDSESSWKKTMLTGT